MTRSSGILLHPTSLPSPFGIGDLGEDAYRFIDFLHDANQKYWQILPLGPTGYGNSPYMCYSAIAGNPFLISPVKLLEAGLLAATDLENIPDFPTHRVDFDKAIAVKHKLFQIAFDRFQNFADNDQKTNFDNFCQGQVYWLDDYALFMALREAHDCKSWYLWEPDLVKREPLALIHWQNTLRNQISYHKFIQFQFFEQWSALKKYANDRNVEIIGDIPIYVAHDSADVWSNQELFELDPETGEVALMAGVPPDYFSETGQLWGNPVYNWQKLADTQFNWWIQRFESLLKLVDVIRVDHFRGFQAFWAVEKGETTAMNGRWIKAPGNDLFSTIQQKWGHLPILAEDLGVITPDVEALRDGYNFPGMKIIQFAFGSDNENPFLPFNHGQNFVVYTGTHDNDTTVGWFEKLSGVERDRFLLYAGGICKDGVHWDAIRLAMTSVASTAIFPLQDILGLGGAARMNFPGVAEGNWEWRYNSMVLNEPLATKLKDLTTICGRSVSSKSN
ncbi:4-alpha-glucanotransferase [Chamaesiphon sp. GL140_3_metabinner_50]|uniref:4-alpha-glucanotransferase n=1 Tax=Chamaesiphon sp. GL140_3_metabinner_50 TaxID=2970812 RepID=UPI0025E7619F|nr:4-alpha-glucanotransferase [Chamaesiphon sp. GL140_3_metabinner_50]